MTTNIQFQQEDVPQVRLEKLRRLATAVDTTSQAVAQSISPNIRTPAEIALGVTRINFKYPPYNVFRYFAVGDGVTDDTVALQTAINVSEQSGSGRMYLPFGQYKITAALAIAEPIIVYGDGCTTGVTLGSIIQNITNDVAAFTINAANNNASQRCVFQDFGIVHRAANHYAIENRRGAYAKHSNVVIDCESTGKGGFLAGSDAYTTTSDLDANDINAWQCVYDHCVVHDAVAACFKANTNGSTLVYRDCSPRTSVAGAKGYLISTNNVHIKGGQAAATGAGGIPVHFLNLRDAALHMGSVEDVRFEGVEIGEYAIVVDGTTDLFFNVEVRRCTMNLANNDGTLAKFARAQGCWLRHPDASSPTGGGLLVEFGQNSVDCGVEGDYQSARAPVTVHASASNPLKVVYGRVTYTNFSNITVDDATPNGVLRTVLRDGLSTTLSLADDAAGSVDLPIPSGASIKRCRVIITSNGPVTGCGVVLADVDSGGAALSIQGGGADLEAKPTGALSGSGDGNDNKVTVSAHTNGKLYLLNRLGATVIFTLSFAPVLDL